LTTIHATCIAINGRGVLLRGPSGAGKSDLAIRLIDGGAQLVSDDYVRIDLQDGVPVARSPKTIEGMIEVRGLGLLRVPNIESVQVTLIADLVDPADIPRLPEPETTEIDGLPGIALRRILVAPFEASAPAKIRLALNNETVGLDDR